MADLFISYSRKDQTFVRRLVTELDKHQRTYWIDWEDIPWTSDWWEEIKTGIESQDNFIFVLSENSLTSPVCMLEVEHAIANNKRLIPIVLNQVEHQDTLDILENLELDAGVQRILQDRDLVKLSIYNWQFLARHNWLFFNDSDTFEQSYSNLMEAIDTDIEHVHFHTRLLIRANEWKDHHHAVDDLLSGSSIPEAETWLGTSVNKNPPPTQLITEYIVASRKRATAIQRRLLIGVSAALLVTVILGILSLILWQQAERERIRADRQARESESGRVAVQALLESNDSVYDRALLLGLEALAIDANREARSSLASTLQQIPKLTSFLHEHQSWVRSVVHAPDGQTFFSADEDGLIIIWDTASNTPIGNPLQGAASGIWALAHHPTQALLASAGNDGIIRLWNTETYELEMSFNTESNSVAYSLAFHPDGSVLTSAHDDNLIYLWDIDSGDIITSLEAHSDWVSILAFSEDGTQMASGGRSADVFLWDTSDIMSPTLALELVGHTNWVFALDFSNDGTILATGGADGTVRLWDTTTGDALGQPLTDHRGWVRSVVFSPDSTMLMTASEDRTIILRDPSSGRRLRGVPPLVGHGEEIFALSAHPSNSSIVTGDQNGDLLVWDLDVTQPFAETISQSTGSVIGLGFNSTDIISISDSGTIQITDERGEALNEPLQVDTPPITAATVSADGTQYAYSVNGEVLVADTSNNTTGLGSHGGFVLALAYNNDASQLASGAEDNLVKLWDVASGEQIGDDITVFETRITALAFSPNGQQLAIGSDDGQIVMLDVETQTVSATLATHHEDDISSLAFSADGRLLASGSYDNSIILWDVVTNEMLGQPMQEHTNWVFDIAFSPDTQTLASVSRDETLILWDIQTRRPIGQPFAGNHSWIWRVSFADDGNHLITGNRDGTIQRWFINIEDWKQRACNIANRPLLEEERDIYLSALSDAIVCDG